MELPAGPLVELPGPLVELHLGEVHVLPEEAHFGSYSVSLKPKWAWGSPWDPGGTPSGPVVEVPRPLVEVLLGDAHFWFEFGQFQI